MDSPNAQQPVHSSTSCIIYVCTRIYLNIKINWKGKST